MKKAGSAGAAVLRYILGIALFGIIFWLFTSGTRILNENNSMQREAKTALDDYIADGREFPEGEYVSLNVRWVIGPFGTLTSTSTTNGITATAGVSYYYYAVLEDATVMAIKTENREERAVLDEMSEWLMSVDGYPMNGKTHKLQGKLIKLQDGDMKKIFREGIQSIFSISPDDPSVRYLVLDTTAGRGDLYFIIIFSLAAVAVVIMLIRRSRKKRLEAENTEAVSETQSF